MIAQFEWNPYTPDFVTAWTTTPVNFDISANDPGKLRALGLAAPTEGRACRWITCGGVGTLALTRLDGTVVTLDATQVGQTFNVQALNLLAAGTTATKVSVYW